MKTLMKNLFPAPRGKFRFEYSPSETSPGQSIDSREFFNPKRLDSSFIPRLTPYLKKSLNNPDSRSSDLHSTL